MRFAVLGSGSKGNAYVVQAGATTVLVDAGFSPRELRRRLRSLDIEVAQLTALLVTHGHGDHVVGARALSEALRLPTYATAQTQLFCQRFGGLKNHVALEPDNSFGIGDMHVVGHKTVHDEKGSVAYAIDDGSARLMIITDLGTTSAALGAALATCDSVVIEHNHDSDMLQRGPYAQKLKRRIASPYGHLSNAAGAALVQAALSSRQPRRVLLAHLSEVNNTPTLALAAARQAVDGADIEVAVCPQHHPTGWLRVARRPSTPLHTMPPAVALEAS